MSGNEQRSEHTLSICVLTYNRARFVEAQVISLLSSYCSLPDGQVEVVVVVNASTDDTLERLARLEHPRLRVVSTDAHFDTVEENMMRSLAHLQGEYVWFLGDDDVVSAQTADFLLERLSRGDADCLVFNSPTIASDGRLLLRQPIPMARDELSLPMPELIETVGLLYTFAGISNVVHRRSNLSAETGLQWLGVSKIYSHVAWFIESHSKSRPVLFFNRPLVLYRQNDYSDSHWERVAAREKVQSFYFWHLGLIRMIERLVERGLIFYPQVCRIMEVNSEGLRYRLVDEVLFKCYQQVSLWFESSSPSERFTTAEFAEIRSFILRVDPSCFETASLYEHLATRMADGKEISADEFSGFEKSFLKQAADRSAAGPFSSRFVGLLHGFEVYQFSGYLIGTMLDPQIRDRILSTIDPDVDDLDVIKARTLGGISEAAIRAHEKRLSLRHVADATSRLNVGLAGAAMHAFGAVERIAQSFKTFEVLAALVMDSASEDRFANLYSGLSAAGRRSRGEGSDSRGPARRVQPYRSLLSDVLAIDRNAVGGGGIVISPRLTIRAIEPGEASYVLRRGTHTEQDYASWIFPTDLLTKKTLLTVVLSGLKDEETGEGAIAHAGFERVSVAGRERLRLVPGRQTVFGLPVVVRTPAALDLLFEAENSAALERVRVSVNSYQPDLEVKASDGQFVLRAELPPERIGAELLEVTLLDSRSPDKSEGALFLDTVVLTMDVPR